MHARVENVHKLWTLLRMPNIFVRNGKIYIFKVFSDEQPLPLCFFSRTGNWHCSWARYPRYPLGHRGNPNSYREQIVIIDTKRHSVSAGARPTTVLQCHPLNVSFEKVNDRLTFMMLRFKAERISLPIKGSQALRPFLSWSSAFFIPCHAEVPGAPRLDHHVVGRFQVCLTNREMSAGLSYVLKWNATSSVQH